MVAISWHGLPQYAARLIRAYSDQVHEEVVVLGVRPQVPVRGMEDVLGHPIVWIEETSPITSWQELGLSVPDVFVQSGWACRPFAVLGKEVKRHGGRVIGLCDNNWRGDLRQWVGAIIFRLKRRRTFDAMFVPGQSSKRLMCCYGMPASKVASGMYGADPLLFSRGTILTQRPKTFLFVGQFIERKGVGLLCKAFRRIRERHPDWTLRLCGDGPLREQFIGLPGVITDGFVQPEDLPARPP